MTLTPRAVLVHRRTELDELIARHGTRGQAAFFLKGRGRTLDEVSQRHDTLARARAEVAAAVPLDWRRVELERADLDRFVFGPEDVIVVVGQDGLVANVAKYLTGQPVIGIDPEPGRNAGVLVSHPPGAAAGLLASAVRHGAARELTMVCASTDDGRRLHALNEVYLGQPGHQTSWYRLTLGGRAPVRQASSGLLVGTGTGATGWCGSAWRERGGPFRLPRPDGPELCWLVREAWSSPTTEVGFTEGLLAADDELELVAESDQLVVFGDGIERDSLRVGWGERVTVRRGPHRLRLLV